MGARVVAALLCFVSLFVHVRSLHIKSTDRRLISPTSSLSHFCNNGYALLQAQLKVLQDSRKSVYTNAGEAAIAQQGEMSSDQQYDITRRQIEREGRLERALKAWPAAQQLLEAKSYESAIKKYKIISLLVPDLATSHCKLALAYLSNGDYNSAAMSVDDALALDAEAADLNYLKGQVLLLQVNSQDACKYFDKVLEKVQNRIDANLGKAICSEDSGLLKDAITYYEKVIRFLPRDAHENGNFDMKPMKIVAIIGMGRVTCKLEKWKKASQYFDRALQFMPQSSEVQLAIGDCHDQHANILSQYSNQDDSGEGDRLKTKAISHYQQATWLNKESIDSNLKLGAILIKEKRFKEALSHLQRATEISLEKSDIISYNVGIELLGDAFYAQYNFNAAEVYYRKVLNSTDMSQRSVKNSLEVKAKLLEVTGRRGNFAVASTLATELIEKKPQDAVMHAKLATLSFFAGNTKIALESARRSIWLDDRCAECYAALGLVEIHTNDSTPSSIANTLSMVDELKQDRDDLLSIQNSLMKGIVYSQLNELQEARSFFEKCVDYSKSFADAPAVNSPAFSNRVSGVTEAGLLFNSLCLNNLAVVKIYLPGAKIKETVEGAKENFKMAYNLVAGKCNELGKEIKRNYDSLLGKGQASELVSFEEDSHMMPADRHITSWLCSHNGASGSTSALLLPLTLGRISAAVLNNIKGIEISGSRSQEQSDTAAGTSWVGWMKGVVTSFVGERKLPRTNTTKQGRSKGGSSMTGINLPHINSMSPPIVVPGAMNKENFVGAPGNRQRVAPSETTPLPNDGEKSDVELMGEYRSYLTNGQINENIGDWKSAVNEYEKAVLLIQKYNSFYRITPDLLHAYGRTLHLSGNRKAAIEIFDQAVYLLDSANKQHQEDPEKVASLLADAGMAHDEGKNIQRAANLYVAAIDTHPQSPDAYYRLARLLVKDGQQNLAVTFYYRLLKMQLTAGVSGVTPRPFKLLITLLYRSQRFEEAGILFRAMLDIGAKPGLEMVRKYVDSLRGLQKHSEAILFIRSQMKSDNQDAYSVYFDLLSLCIKEEAALNDAKFQLKSSIISSTDDSEMKNSEFNGNQENAIDLDTVESAIAIAPENLTQVLLVEAGKMLVNSKLGSPKFLQIGENYLREAINASNPNHMRTVEAVLALSKHIEAKGFPTMDLSQLEELIRFSEFVLDNVASMGFHGDLPPVGSFKASSQSKLGIELLAELRSRDGLRKVAWARIVRILAYVGNWEEAERQCRKWLSEMPNDAAALSALSKIFLLGFDDLDRSVEVFDKAMKHLEIELKSEGSNVESKLVSVVKEDASVIIKLAHQIGSKYFMNNDFTRSKDFFMLSYDLSVKPGINSRDLEVLSSEFLAKNDFATGYISQAKKRLLDIGIENLTWGGHKLLGDMYKQGADSGDTEMYMNAIASYREALKFSNNVISKADLHYLLGSSLLSYGEYKAAAENLRASMAVQPNNSHVLNNLGVAYFHLNRKVEAQQLIESSVKLDDGCMARFNLGAFLYDSRQYESAATHFRHALRLCRNAAKNGDEEAMKEADIQVRLANSLRKDARKLPEALALYKEVLKSLKAVVLPDNSEKPVIAAHEMQLGAVLAEIGDLLISLDRHLEAIDVIYESMQIRSKNGDNSTRLKSRIDYGNALLYAGRLNEAKDQYEIVLKAAPTYVTAFNNLGVIAYRSRKRKEAIAWFSKVLKHDSRHVEARLALEQLTRNGPEMPIVSDGVNALVHKIVRDTGI